MDRTPDVSPSHALAVVRLLAVAGDPTVERPIADRRRILLRGMQGIVQADSWISFTGELRSLDENSDISSGLQYDGFDDDEDPVALYTQLSYPLVLATFERPQTTGNSDVDIAVFSSDKLNFDSDRRPVNRLGPRGLHPPVHHVTSLKVNRRDATYCGVSFLRKQLRPNFSSAEHALVVESWRRIDWLNGSSVEPTPAGDMSALTPRERDVMHLLLSGKSRKEVARVLQLSQHTVSDYLKNIYSKLRVCTRAELLAKFIPKADGNFSNSESDGGKPQA